MNEWLKDSVTNLPCNTYHGKYDASQYYTAKEMIKYKNNSPQPGTRFHDSDCLFKQLVDHCIDQQITNIDKSPIINSSMKRQFLKYVYETSVK